MSSPGYLAVFGHSLDPPGMRAYSDALPPIYDAHKGFYLGIGGPGRGVDLLEGSWFGHSLVYAQFPTQRAISDFWWSDAYRDAKKLREGAGVFNVVALGGNGNLAHTGTPAFLISCCEVADEQAYSDYQDGLSELLADIDARTLAMAEPKDLTILEGEFPNQHVTVHSFVSLGSATSFWNGNRYKQLEALRGQAGRFNIFLVMGQRRDG